LLLLSMLAFASFGQLEPCTPTLLVHHTVHWVNAGVIALASISNALHAFSPSLLFIGRSMQRQAPF
jgi:hypothetical protein